LCHGYYAEEKNGSAASELRCRCALLHHGRVLAPTEYKVVARLIASESGLPSDRHPDRAKRAVVLEAVKVWPGEGGACRKVVRRPTLTAPERADVRESRVGTQKRAFRSNKETDEG
jgi:hypothetical protein